MFFKEIFRSRRANSLIHPDVLKDDFSSLEPKEYSDMKISEMAQYIYDMDIDDEDEILFLAEWWEKIWWNVNLGAGIPMKDREKLVPAFRAMGMVFNYKDSFPTLYRGVYARHQILKAVSNVILGNGHISGVISQNSPLFITLAKKYGVSKANDMINQETIPVPKELYNNNPAEKIIKGLSYGTRSWTEDKKDALKWAFGISEKVIPGSDKFVFAFKNPGENALFECNGFIDHFDEVTGEEAKTFDADEVIVNVHNPQIVSVTLSPHSNGSRYIVTIK